MIFFTLYNFIFLAAVATSLTILLTIIHRLFFHDLRAFPGPVLAATTSLYKTYYDVLKRGELLRHLKVLHEIYGPVIRIAPNELHFNNHTAHSNIYAVGSHFTKDQTFYKCFGVDGSTFGAIHPRDVKLRKNTLSPFFSTRAILNFEGVIQDKVDKLISRLLHRQQIPTNLFLAFRCIALDIISSYFFGKSANSLDAKDFRDPFIVATQSAIPSIWMIKFLPFIGPLLSTLPLVVVDRLTPSFLAFAHLNRIVSSEFRHFVDDECSFADPGNHTICQHLLQAHKANSSRFRHDLIQEAFSLLQAGSEGPGNACTVGTFHVLNDPTIRLKLFNELSDAWPDKTKRVGYAVLRKLPYLTAVIKESLRISHGVVSPLPRIVGPTSANISGYHVPAGTVVGVSVTYLHDDPSIFREPHIFSPERWMQPNSKELEKHLVPFSRGPRMCLGINLAWCELYLIFGNIFRRLDLDIHDTTVEDFKNFKEFFTPVHQGRNFHVIAKGSLI